MPVAALISTDPTNGPHTAGVPFKFDASPKIGAFSSTIIHYFTALNSLTSRDCATFQAFLRGQTEAHWCDSTCASKAGQRLEQRLGDRLIHRSTLAVTLTGEGREVIRSARQLLDATTDVRMRHKRVDDAYE